ncbi:ABC transporter permease [Actinoallomurus bryophytorum]|uniref:NitT/TauT family transport system permease protein n=1 Tax=Actinoallomurus bryophytorum TaxID=1490222 RepID=A0A543CU39_9ACTN|nr:ABC transporter permease [Actinoallomurus bryophytorum]TQM00625.1 NitT/TauT family transport system permease protein [Actinoallomurus bryophytorum]
MADRRVTADDLMAGAGARTARWRPSALWLPLLGAVVVVALWWLTTIVFAIQPFILPAPPDITEAFFRLPGYLLRQTWTTLVETLAGFGLAVAGGLLAAVALSASRVVERALFPLLVAANAVPKIAVAPLLIVWLGFGSVPKVVMVFLISFFPIVVAAVSGLASMPAELGELARSLSASRRQMFVKLRIPWALPQIFIGLKVGITLAVVGAVVGEFSGGDRGLGYVIVASGASADTALAFAAMTLLAVMSVTLFYLVSAAERLLLPWAREIAG